MRGEDKEKGDRHSMERTAKQQASLSGGVTGGGAESLRSSGHLREQGREKLVDDGSSH